MTFCAVLFLCCIFLSTCAFCDMFFLHLTVIKRAQQGYEGQAEATSPHAQIRPLANELDIKRGKERAVSSGLGKK